MEKLDTVVIGAGVVGLAIARALALAGREVIVLEKNKTFGQETSSRNSEVIHTGIYYPHNSVKAQSCVNGKAALYQYCMERQISHKKIGKLIVATQPQELPTLKSYIEKAKANGVDDLELLNAAEALALEPNINTVGAILSPSTGIIDSHELMMNYIADIEAHGGLIIYDSPVLSGQLSPQELILTVGGNSATQVSCKFIVNAAGIAATKVAHNLKLPPESIPTPYYAKGHYFSLASKSPFQRLIYPLANNAGLGIHATLDLNNRVKFGPDVQWIDNEDYSFDESRKKTFVDAIRRYYPDLDEHAISPDYTGIRPKISGPDAPPADFTIQNSISHGIPGLINLYGIESPGLTASMAIAEEIVEALHRKTNA